MSAAIVASIAGPELEAGFAAAHGICREAAPDLYRAALFLPQPKRDAVAAVCGMAHMICEVIGVDRLYGVMALREHPAVMSPEAAWGSCGGENDLQVRLEMLEQRLNELAQDRLELPAPEGRSPQQHTLFAAGWVIRQYGLSRERLMDIGRGRMAEQKVLRYATWASLERHCQQSAGALGVLITGILGAQHSGAGDFAAETGSAIYVTRLLSNLGKGIDAGRVILPLEDMQKFGYTEQELLARVVNERFRELMWFEIDRVRMLYRRGAEGICWLADDKARLFASAIAITSADALRAIERAHYDVLNRTARPSVFRKITRLPRVWRLARRKHDQAMPNVFG